MAIASGIEALDRRIGGLTPGGLYVVAGVPGSGKFASSLQFLNAGVRAGDAVALVAATLPEKVFEHGRHWGFELEGAWRRGQMKLLGYADDFERRLLRAADPQEAFDQLTLLLGGEVSRLAIDPGKALWDTRAGTSVANRFLQWMRAGGATTWATLASDLSDSLSPASDWVLEAATGVFNIERVPSGLRQLWIHRLSPPTDMRSPISLELVPGHGLMKPAGRMERRATDAPLGDDDRLLLLQLADKMPDEIAGWMKRRYAVVETEEALRSVSRFQAGETFGVILIYLDKRHGREAVDACRVFRPLTAAPILLLSDDTLRADDRRSALDAGANDFLSDGFSIGELASRIDRAVQEARGLPIVVRMADAAGPPVNEAGLLERPAFAKAVHGRLADKNGGLFTLVLIEGAAGSTPEIGETLAHQVRADQGDIAGKVSEGFAVLLQGTRPNQADAFLIRVRKKLGRNGSKMRDSSVRLFNSVTEAKAIADLIRTESS